MRRLNINQILTANTLKFGFEIKPVRELIFKYLDKYAFTNIVKQNDNKRLKKVQEDKYAMVSSILNAGKKGINRKLIGEKPAKRLFDNLFGKTFLKTNENFYRFVEKYGIHPPSFLVISPTGACNLRCIGCYANSSEIRKITLPYSIFKRILKEKIELWGSHFTVISGGEPFLYKSEGKNLLDIFEENIEQIFLVYTNGTLFTDEISQRLGELGNVTPAISVEGFEKETDARRGKGTFKRIMDSIENLKKYGVPFGISTTATYENCDIITSEEFWNLFFEKLGALYQWIFQYMPIGRNRNLKLMVTPEQRIEMYERTWRAIKDKKYFIADFWNCGTVSDGCISAGAAYGGGYFYITWTGDVTPCVFNPFKVDNIIKVYNSGGYLNTIFFSPYFKDIRNWQRKYYNDKPLDEMGNLLAPCPIRDHFSDMKKILLKNKAIPIDSIDNELLSDDEVERSLDSYDREFQNVSNPIWHERYIKSSIKQLRAKGHGF